MKYDVEFLKLIKKYFPGSKSEEDGQSSGLMVGFPEASYCSEQGQSGTLPFDYGKEPVTVDNSIFDRILEETGRFTWSDMEMYTSLVTCDIPKYNDGIFFLTSLSVQTSQFLSGLDKVTPNYNVACGTAEDLWKNVHYATFEKREHMNRFGYITPKMVKDRFYAMEDIPIPMNLNCFSDLGYKLMDVRGDGNCASYSKFLAMLNAGRDLKKQGKPVQDYSTSAFEELLAGFEEVKDVPVLRKEFHDYIVSKNPDQWFKLDPTLQGVADHYDGKKSYIEYGKETIYKEGVNYFNKKTMKNDRYHYDSIFFGSFFAQQHNLRVVMFQVMDLAPEEQQPSEFRTEQTIIFDYRLNNKGGKQVETFQGIHRIPDDDFDFRETIEIVFLTFREGDRQCAHFNVPKRIRPHPLNDNNTDSTASDLKYSKANIMSMLIPLGPDRPIVSVYLCNHNKKPLPESIEKEYNAKNDEKPFLMVNCAKGWLKDNEHEQIFRRVLFILLVLQQIESWTENFTKKDMEVMQDTVAMEGKNAVSDIYRMTSELSRKNPWNIQIYYLQDNAFPRELNTSEWSVFTALCVFAARNLYNETEAKTKEEIWEKTFETCWGRLSEEDVITFNRDFRRCFALLLYYVRSANVKGYGPLSQEEVHRKQENALFDGLITSNDKNHKEFLKFFNNKDKNESLFRKRTTPTSIQPDPNQGNQGEDILEPEIPLERQYNPERLEIVDGDYKKLSEEEMDKLKNMKDTVNLDDTKKLFNIKRIHKVAAAFAVNQDRTEEGRLVLDRILEDKCSVDKDDYRSFVGDLCEDYYMGKNDIEEETVLRTRKRYPKHLNEYAKDNTKRAKAAEDALKDQRNNHRRIQQEIQTDPRVDYSLNEFVMMGMEAAETVIAADLQSEELQRLSKDHNERSNGEGNEPTEEEKTFLQQVRDSVTRLENRVHDQLDIMFPVNDIYGYNYNKTAAQISKMRYNCNNHTFYGLSEGKEKPLRTDWLQKNFHPKYLAWVQYTCEQKNNNGIKTHKRWLPIPAGDSREDNKNLSMEEIEIKNEITYVPEAPVRFLQGDEKYCVACSFASAMYLLGFKEIAECVIKMKKDISNADGKRQINMLHSDCKKHIDKKYIKEMQVITKEKSAARLEPDKMNLKNTIWFVIPITHDDGVNHAFAIMNFEELGKVIVDANDLFAIRHSKTALDYCCGGHPGYKSIRYAIRISFKNLNLLEKKWNE